MKKWSTGKILLVVFGSIGAVFVLGITFVISLVQLARIADRITDGNDRYPQHYSYGDYYDNDGWNDDSNGDGEYNGKYNNGQNDNYNDDNDKKSNKNNGDSGSGTDSEYYEFADDIRSDLSYQVDFETYSREDFASLQEGMASINFVYPVISGDVPNVEGINQMIYSEVNEAEEYLAEAAEELSEGEYFDFTGTAYVTYMAEEVLSIIYVEYGYLNDEFFESYVISLNFDMETGMLLSNANLIEVDDAFSVDFRERCETQNGEIYSLSYLSDQQITSYLTDEDYLIIFYTPLGMEIGFNYYDGWVTVTYKDFEKYQKQF